MRYTLGKSKVIINQFGKNKLRNNVIVSLIPRFLLGALTVRKVESEYASQHFAICLYASWKALLKDHIIVGT